MSKGGTFRRGSESGGIGKGRAIAVAISSTIGVSLSPGAAQSRRMRRSVASDVAR